MKYHAHVINHDYYGVMRKNQDLFSLNHDRLIRNWVFYNEVYLCILYLLGLVAPSGLQKKSLWNAWTTYNRNVVEDNRQKYPIGYNIPNWLFQITNWWYFNQLGICDLFSDSASPDSYIPNPKFDIVSPIGDLTSPIGDYMPNWGYWDTFSARDPW